jgi:ribonuclease BN (tRNA processing enzyme)
VPTGQRELESRSFVTSQASEGFRLQVTVLGKSPAWEDAAGACSGYLIRHEGFTLLLDCGNGVFGKLRERIDYPQVDAVLVTHLHADHCFDVLPFSYALIVGPRAGTRHPALYVPPGAESRLRALGGWVGDERLIPDAFEIREYAAGPLALGPLSLRAREVPHFVPTHAVSLAAEDGSRLVFSADCGPNDALVELGAGADLMLVEATLRDPDPSPSAGHLSARQAGEHGRAAGVGRLVLTHFSDELDPVRVHAEGSAGFEGEVQLAAEGLTVEL